MVNEDVALMFRMKLLYMVADHYKPEPCDKVLFGMEQPQDPKEYRTPEEVALKGFMSVFRTMAWRHFQEKYAIHLTSFEQGAYGHRKPKPTTLAHNIDGVDQLGGAKMNPAEMGSWNESGTGGGDQTSLGE